MQDIRSIVRCPAHARPIDSAASTRTQATTRAARQSPRALRQALGVDVGEVVGSRRREPRRHQAKSRRQPRRQRSRRDRGKVEDQHETDGEHSGGDRDSPRRVHAVDDARPLDPPRYEAPTGARCRALGDRRALLCRRSRLRRGRGNRRLRVGPRRSGPRRLGQGDADQHAARDRQGDSRIDEHAVREDDADDDGGRRTEERHRQKDENDAPVGIPGRGRRQVATSHRSCAWAAPGFAVTLGATETARERLEKCCMSSSSTDDPVSATPGPRKGRASERWRR